MEVTQRGRACTIILGKDPEKDGESPELIDVLKSAGTKHNWMDNPYPEIRSKFIFITSFGLVTANFDKTLAQVLESGELRDYERAEKPDERDLFGGAIIRMGKQYNIKVETTRLICDSLSQNK